MRNWFKENYKHLSRILDFSIDFIFERLFCIIPILILIIFVSWIFLKYSIIINAKEVEAQEILLFGISLENLSTWLAVIGLVATAFWSLLQYEKSRTAKQQEKASEIAKSFSDELYMKCSIICEVIQNSSLYDFLQLGNMPYDSLKTFNTNEIRQIYNDDNFIDKYISEVKNANLDQIYYKILDSRISFNTFRGLKAINKQYSVREARKLFILDNSGLPFKFKELVSNVLNELEYLCMSLSSQAAGSKYVYLSLHQIFLRTIRVLSMEIAISNNNLYSDKYFTSIINVYNEWTYLYTENLKKEKKLKNKISNILNPKIKTV